MEPNDIAHAWTHPDHVGGSDQRPRRVSLLSVAVWNEKRLWRVRFLDEVNQGELDYNENCLRVIEEEKRGGDQ